MFKSCHNRWLMAHEDGRVLFSGNQKEWEQYVVSGAKGTSDVDMANRLMAAAFENGKFLRDGTPLYIGTCIALRFPFMF